MEDTMNRFDVFDTTDGDDMAIEIAHGVSAKVAAELAGIPMKMFEGLARRFPGEMDLGSTCVSLDGSHQELWIRSTINDSQD